MNETYPPGRGLPGAAASDRSPAWTGGGAEIRSVRTVRDDRFSAFRGGYGENSGGTRGEQVRPRDRRGLAHLDGGAWRGDGSRTPRGKPAQAVARPGGG